MVNSLTQLVVFCRRSKSRCWSFGPGPERKAFTRLLVLGKWLGAITSTWAKYFCKVDSKSGTGRLGRMASFCKAKRGEMDDYRDKNRRSRIESLLPTREKRETEGRMNLSSRNGSIFAHCCSKINDI